MSSSRGNDIDEQLDRVGCASLVDAMGRVHGHRAHLLGLGSPSPRRLFGRVATIAFLPYRDDLPDAPYTYMHRLVEGRVAFLEWTAESEHARVRDGADSFLIEDGWIVAQTIHYTVEPT